MQSIVILGLISFVFIVGSIVLFFVAITKKKMSTFYFALILSLIGVGFGIYTGFSVLSKSYSKISKSLEPRTKEEIYAALFDGNPTNCSVVLETQDQVLPVIDFAIYLHFKTCETELNRILNLKRYEKEVLVNKEKDNTINTTNPDWFEPLKMGDSIMVYTSKKDDFGNYQTLYVSKNKDEVYCIDVAQ